MPSRYIREGWIDSARIDNLDSKAEAFFLRLCLKADDFGRYTANPVALKNTLYPLKDDVRATDSSRYLAACEKAGLVRCYLTIKGPTLEIQDFKQRTRAEKSAWPSPDEALPDGCPTDDGQTSASFENENENENEHSSKPAAVDGSGWSFDTFWEAYPRKVGKQAAAKAWNAAKTRPALAAILSAIETQKRSEQWQKDGGQFIPHPATWLNEGRWADEPVKVVKAPANAAADKQAALLTRVREKGNFMEWFRSQGYARDISGPEDAPEEILREFLKS